MSERAETIAESRAVEAWHFLPDDRRLRWGTQEVIHPGSVVVVEPPLALCRHGLHASVRAIDALEYAPGPVVSRVLVWGDAIYGDDKLCGTHRKALWIADATDVLHRFACDVAAEALDLVESKGAAIDPRSRDAVAVKLAWLKGEANDADLAAARDAAWDVASAAARGAAWGVASAAARGAAWGAAWGAASAAAWAAARDARNRRLHDLLMDLRDSRPATSGRK